MVHDHVYEHVLKMKRTAVRSRGENQGILENQVGATGIPVSVCVFKFTEQQGKAVLQVCSHWEQMFAET